MFFCFDVIDGQEGTVALTCPKVPLGNNVTIAKCCPPGEKILIGDESLESEGCGPVEDDEPWQISINGYIYNSTDLIKQNKLIFDNRSLVSII